jgi:hypothetical protein
MVFGHLINERQPDDIIPYNKNLLHVSRWELLQPPGLPYIESTSDTLKISHPHWPSEQ